MPFNTFNLNLNINIYSKGAIMELFSQFLNFWLLLTFEVLELFPPKS